ncbi:MAG TPA: ATP-binding protein [Kofleriaceae bacterium]|nr:ATP-binding protein [Kofleriaceae bacterium]
MDEITAVLELTHTSHTSRRAVRPSLVCVSGADLGRSFRVGLDALVIGRGHADIALAETDVSRRHARFGFGDHGFEITDLGSVNGTSVNGHRIEGTVPVRVGDRIQIGRTVLLFAQHDELEERVARAQRLEAMATLAGGIAHDFNNALSVVLCNLDVIAHAIPAHEGDALSCVDEVRAATTAAAGLARRLLRLGRAEPMSFESVALEQLASQTAMMARRRTKAPIELVIAVPGELRVLGSYDELHQVVLNLCNNACDAMPDGGRLAITARPIELDTDHALARQLPAPGSYVEIEVTDSGHGMDEETMTRAFEPFFTTKPRDRGTGLGLAMIHTTVRRHGGAIEVESTVGVGTTFRIALPRFGLRAV